VSIIGLSINQDEIGFDVTVPVVFPLARESMIVMPRRKCLVLTEESQNF